MNLTQSLRIGTDARFDAAPPVALARVRATPLAAAAMQPTTPAQPRRHAATAREGAVLVVVAAAVHAAVVAGWWQRQAAPLPKPRLQEIELVRPAPRVDVEPPKPLPEPPKPALPPTPPKVTAAVPPPAPAPMPPPPRAVAAAPAPVQESIVPPTPMQTPATAPADPPLVASAPETPLPLPAAVVAAAPAPAPVHAPPAAPPAPKADEPLTEASADADYLKNPPPVYPKSAQRQGLQGRVLLRVQVLASGHAGNVEVKKSSGAAVLDDAALTAVRSWTFVPARRGSTPVDGWTTVPIDFKLAS